MTLQAGDLLFVGIGSERKSFQLITTTDIAGGERIYFTDRKWDPSRENFKPSNENTVFWTVPDRGLTKGTVITFKIGEPTQANQQFFPANDTSSNAYLRIGNGPTEKLTDPVFGHLGANNAIWAYQVDSIDPNLPSNSQRPSNFIAVVATYVASCTHSKPLDLTGTGLSKDTSPGGAILMDDAPYLEWAGNRAYPFFGQVWTQDNLIASVMNLGNWTIGDCSTSPACPQFGKKGNVSLFELKIAPCFTNGARIAVRGGQKDLADIRTGDEVLTLNGDYTRVVGMFQQKISAKELANNEKLYPVFIKKGAMGGGLPRRDISISQDHRLLVSSPNASQMTKPVNTLVPATQLTALDDLAVGNNIQSFSYFHLFFDQNHVVFVEGTPTESLCVCPQSLKSVSDTALGELWSIFPCKFDDERKNRCEPAAPRKNGKGSRSLVIRSDNKNLVMLVAGNPPECMPVISVSNGSNQN